MKSINTVATITVVLLLGLFTWQCQQSAASTDPPKADDGQIFTIQSPFNSNVTAEPRLRFPDFGFMLEPGEYRDRVFLLSQDFPKEKPVIDAGVEKILSIDFKTDWEAYALAVRDYVLEGNGTKDYENSFYLEDNDIRDWYHVPWQHWGDNGREGVHGLTREGPIAEQMLGPDQHSQSHAYAVGFYNDLGGYAIGQVWPEAGPPDMDYLIEGNGFPEGTVVGKVLFTTLGEEEVAYLANPISWNAYIYADDVPGNQDSVQTDRKIAPVNLIQMDIMVRDERAISTGGWVFGTFVYNGTLGNDNRWYNLQPVGIMWGNDPDVKISLDNEKPTETKTNPALTETIINPDPSMPPMHLGWGFRLNGPVDNANSSCMSCHSTAQYPAISSILPMFNDPPVPVPPINTDASVEWMKWFRNVPCGTPFDPGTSISFDYSLQLQKSIENYIEYLDETKQGKFFLQYWDSPNKASRNIIALQERQ